MTHLPLMVIPSIIMRSSLNVQYCLMSYFTSFLLNIHHLMMYSFSSCRCMSCCVVFCMFYIDIHVGMSEVVLMVSMFCLMPSITLPYFLHDSVLKASHLCIGLQPSKCSVQILYWWKLHSIWRVCLGTVVLSFTWAVAFLLALTTCGGLGLDFAWQ